MSHLLIELFVFLAILLLVGPIVKLIYGLWRVVYKMHFSKSVDLKNEYGDWAGMKVCYYYIFKKILI